MKKMVLISALLMASLYQVDVFAQQHLEGRTTYTRMESVAENQYQKAQEKMNQSYQLLVDMLDSIAIAKLNTAQESWKKFSEADCKFTTDYSRNEPLEKIIYQDCLTSQTENRTVDLEYQVRRNFTLDPELAMTKHKR